MPRLQVPERVSFVCRVADLRVGDQVLTTAHRWETITGLECGEAYSRSTRVTTDATGEDYPWVWVNRRWVRARRLVEPQAVGLGVAA